MYAKIYYHHEFSDTMGVDKIHNISIFDTSLANMERNGFYLTCTKMLMI